jgi:hypothetical protein
MQGWAADGAPADSSSGGSSGGGGEASPGGDDTPAAPQAVAAFFVEQGLTSKDAERLAEAIGGLNAGLGDASSSGVGGSSSTSSGSSGSGSGVAGGGGRAPPPLSLSRLQAKWLGLQRVLPDADLAGMVGAEQGCSSGLARCRPYACDSRMRRCSCRIPFGLGMPGI